MPLNPKVYVFLRQLSMGGSSALNQFTPQEARARFSASMAMFRMPEGCPARVEDWTIPGPYREIPVRMYTPDGEGLLPVVVFYHGGGFVLGDLDQYDNMCRRLANAAGAIVVSVDYGLAPEYKFPKPVEEAYAALCWVAEHAGEFGGDSQRLSVAGDSAGGNLSAVVSLLARDRKGPHLRGQVLMYAPTDFATVTESKRRNATGYFLEEEDMVWFREMYLRSVEDALSPLASPLRADSLKGLPPAFIVTAEYDPLHDEGVAYAKRLASSGVATRHLDYEGMIHGFMSMPWLVDEAVEAIEEAGAQLREFFAGHVSRD